MKRLLLAALLLFAFPAHAQRKPRPQPASTLTVPVVYCELVQTSYTNGLGLDYGQDGPTYVQDADLAEAGAFVGKLSSVAAALNYLHSRGWELVGTTTVPYEVTPSGLVSSRAHYQLRRRTP